MKPMQFQITDIEFDCSLDDDDWTEKDQYETEENLPKSNIGTIWDADDPEDLVEQISSQSGWCLKSLDFEDV